MKDIEIRRNFLGAVWIVIYHGKFYTEISYFSRLGEIEISECMRGSTSFELFRSKYIKVE